MGELDALTLQQARSLLPGNLQVSTLWRWCMKGCRGHRLRHMRVGRRIYVTHAALVEFFEAIRDEELRRAERRPAPKAAPPLKRRQRELSQTCRRLRRRRFVCPDTATNAAGD